MKECQSVENILAFGEAAVPGRVSVAGPEGRPTGELQFGEDSAIVFLSRGAVGFKRPHHGKTPEMGQSPPGWIS